MKALVRQHPLTPSGERNDEVYLGSAWHDWIKENGSPLTDENYGYALCEDVPEECADSALPSDFDITMGTRTEQDPMGDGTVEVRFWTAVFNRAKWESHAGIE